MLTHSEAPLPAGGAQPVLGHALVVQYGTANR